MRRVCLAVVGIVAVSGMSGCTYIAATPSVQGKGYVVRQELFTSSFWNCDATSGEPVCFQAKKQYTPQPKAQ